MTQTRPIQQLSFPHLIWYLALRASPRTEEEYLPHQRTKWHVSPMGHSASEAACLVGRGNRVRSQGAAGEEGGPWVLVALEALFGLQMPQNHSKERVHLGLQGHTQRCDRQVIWPQQPVSTLLRFLCVILVPLMCQSMPQGVALRLCSVICDLFLRTICSPQTLPADFLPYWYNVP